MITVTTKKFKSFSLTNYNNLIDNLPFHSLTCTCGSKGDLVKHGTYPRNIKLSEGKLTLKIQRVKCNSCGKTHAILPEWIIPYSSVTLSDQTKIIDAFITGKDFSSIMLDNPEIDESNIRYVLNQFLYHWKERLIAFKITLDDEIVKSCFKYFNRQFMQIKSTLNILFS